MPDVQNGRPARPQGLWRAERTSVREHDKVPRTPLADILSIRLEHSGDAHAAGQPFNLFSHEFFGFAKGFVRGRHQ